MSISQIDVHLTLPPAKRWDALFAFRDQARQLLDQYVTDFIMVPESWFFRIFRAWFATYFRK